MRMSLGEDALWTSRTKLIAAGVPWKSPLAVSKAAKKVGTEAVYLAAAEYLRALLAEATYHLAVTSLQNQIRFFERLYQKAQRQLGEA